MVDQCVNCSLRGDIKSCRSTDCSQHESWYAKEQQKTIGGLLCALSCISNMCVGELALGYKLDAQEIGEMIYKSTGMTQPELAKYVEKNS